MALGEYRGPKSVKAFMHYATARFRQVDREETYRIYVTEYLAGKTFEMDYYELVHGEHQRDFDAEQVVDDVISRMGLEEEWYEPA